MPLLAALVVPPAFGRRHSIRPMGTTSGDGTVRRAEGGDPRGALVDGPPLRVDELSPMPDIETLFQVGASIRELYWCASARAFLYVTTRLGLV